MKTSISTLALVCAALSGCSVTPNAPDPFLTQGIEAEAPTLASDVSAEFAAAYLPSLAGSIQSVRQSVAKDSLHQEVVYANQTALEGENVLTIDVGQPGTAAMLRPPSEAQIRREMRSAFTGVTLSLNPTIRQNQNGIYGYATAAYGDQGACLYAWQRVKSVNPSDSSGFARLSRVHLAATIRLRYCHPAIGPDRIHTVMDGLRVKDINSQTIDMLRFASGSAEKAAPLVVVTPDVVAAAKPQRRKVVRVEPETDDWRKDAALAPDTDPAVAAPVIVNAAAVPLPGDGAVVTVPVIDPASNADVLAVEDPIRIKDAAAVPLPE